jgi:hypothetical protein
MNKIRVVHRDDNHVPTGHDEPTSIRVGNHAHGARDHHLHAERTDP